VRQPEFTAFYEANRDACLRAVMVSVADPELAQDLVAEAFTRAWTSWSTVRRHPAPAAWIVRTALNTNVSWWRRRRKEVSWLAGHEGEPLTDRGAGVDPELLAVLRGLSPRQREVIALRVFLDLDSRTTAEILGIAEGTVTAHMARAIAALRGSLVHGPQQEVAP
jgi:RNA polymerase sigma-70 factor (ECF subfamily)